MLNGLSLDLSHSCCHVMQRDVIEKGKKAALKAIFQALAAIWKKKRIFTMLVYIDTSSWMKSKKEEHAHANTVFIKKKNSLPPILAYKWYFHERCIQEDSGVDMTYGAISEVRVFRCDVASLWEGVSVRPSVGPSVRPSVGPSVGPERLLSDACQSHLMPSIRPCLFTLSWR